MWSSEMILIICVTIILAGFAKGVVGFGLPVISVALLTATVGLKEAMALIILPAILTNIWQALAGGHLRMLLQRLWPFLLSVCIAIWFSVRLIAVVDVFWLSTLLGLVTLIYALFGLLSIHLPAPGKHESWLTPLVGGVNGVITGLTAMYVVPGGLYFLGKYLCGSSVRG